MIDVCVIDRADAAQAVLEPLRAQILEALRAPGSASSVAAALGVPRQKVNYHLRTLEDHGLVELVEERPRRGLTERIVQASASSYLISPEALGPNAAQPVSTDRLSSRYLLAIAGRLIREVGELAYKADERQQPLATLTIDTEIRFGSAADRAAFTEALAASVTELSARFHDETAPRGRWHRLIVAAHPFARTNEEKATTND